MLTVRLAAPADGPAVIEPVRALSVFEWFVLDRNTNAQTFYDGLGAQRLDSWRLCRVTL